MKTFLQAVDYLGDAIESIGRALLRVFTGGLRRR